MQWSDLRTLCVGNKTDLQLNAARSAENMPRDLEWPTTAVCLMDSVTASCISECVIESE